MKYLTTYTPNPTADATTKRADMHSARELTTHLITGMWLVYRGHKNPNDASYKGFKSWFTDDYDFQTTLTKDETAVKNLLKEFDRNFELYKNLDFFTAFLSDTTIALAPYREDNEQTTILNYKEVVNQTLRNNKLVPVEELRRKDPAECDDLRRSVINIKQLSAAASTAR